MTKKEIDTILETENVIVHIKKKSEHSFFEAAIGFWVYIYCLVFSLPLTKQDHIIITESSLRFIKKNKVYYIQNLTNIKSINYNGNKTLLEITDQGKKISISISKFRPTHKESGQIRKAFIEFTKRSNNN